MNKRECTECGDRFFGRSDKRFCGDNCRSVHNNRINQSHRKIMRNINNLLAKNRRILLEIKERGLEKIHREFLLEHGFSFKYFTAEFTTHEGEKLRFCYEQGYKVMDSGHLMLVEQDAYQTQ